MQQDGLKAVEEASGKAQVLLAFTEEDLDFPSFLDQAQHRDGFGVEVGGHQEVISVVFSFPFLTASHDDQDSSQDFVGGEKAPVMAQLFQSWIVMRGCLNQVVEVVFQLDIFVVVQCDPFVFGQRGGDDHF